MAFCGQGLSGGVQGGEAPWPGVSRGRSPLDGVRNKLKHTIYTNFWFFGQFCIHFAPNFSPIQSPSIHVHPRPSKSICAHHVPSRPFLPILAPFSDHYLYSFSIHFCRQFNLSTDALLKLWVSIRLFLAVGTLSLVNPALIFGWDIGDEKTEIFCGKGYLPIHHH